MAHSDQPVDRERYNAFIELVRNMRALQTAYFDHKSQENLFAAKSAEEKVDSIVRQHDSNQMELF